jgi:8-oxo-dGTP pyrophosphatase MutT (NUDIX family)
MPHIHTQPGQHDFTTSAYIIRLDLPEPAVILHKHKILKKWIQFGGHIELNETPWQAIAHEVLEESGYEMHQLRLLQPFTPALQLTDATLHPWPAATLTMRFSSDTEHFHTDIANAFTTTALPEHPLGAGESQEIRLFTRNEVAALPDDDIPANVRNLCLCIFDVYLGSWASIPADSWPQLSQPSPATLQN